VVVSSSPFDEIGQRPDWNDQDIAEFNRRDELIHRVFAQSDSGRELLEVFKGQLMLTSGDSRGRDLYSLGVEEGIKTFMRNILLTVRKVENE
jgi:hypothetical protein